jgi:hypothetical protein
MNDGTAPQSPDGQRKNTFAMVSFPIELDGMKTFENMHTTCFDRDSYVLDNSPFYAYEISVGDTVAAEKIDGRLVFNRVLKRSGHSTYRVKLRVGQTHEFFLQNWGKLADLGCSFEGSTAGRRLLYSIDVPKTADVYAVYAALQAGEDNSLWEFEEAHYCKPNEHPT